MKKILLLGVVLLTSTSSFAEFGFGDKACRETLEKLSDAVIKATVIGEANVVITKKIKDDPFDKDNPIVRDYSNGDYRYIVESKVTFDGGTMGSTFHYRMTANSDSICQLKNFRSILSKFDKRLTN